MRLKSGFFLIPENLIIFVINYNLLITIVKSQSYIAAQYIFSINKFSGTQVIVLCDLG